MAVALSGIDRRDRAFEGDTGSVDGGDSLALRCERYRVHAVPVVRLRLRGKKSDEEETGQ